MGRFADSALTVVITFFVSLMLNTASSLFTQASVRITTGTAVLGNQPYAVFEIENFSSKSLDGVRVDMSQPMDAQSVVTEPRVSVSEPTGVDGPSRRIVLSGIDPKRITRVYVPVQAVSDAAAVNIANSSELGAHVRTSTSVAYPWDQALREAFVISIIYSLIAGLLMFWTESRLAKSRQSIQELKDESKSIRAQSDEIREASDAIKKNAERALARLRLTIVARMHDYATELDFWRNLVKQLILQQGGTHADAKQLHDSVTRSLRTWGTKRATFDEDYFTSVQTLAALLAKPDVPTDEHLLLGRTKPLS